MGSVILHHDCTVSHGTLSARDNFEKVPQKQKRERDAGGCRNEPHPPAVVTMESLGSRPKARHEHYDGPHNFIDGLQGHVRDDRTLIRRDFARPTLPLASSAIP